MTDTLVQEVLAKSLPAESKPPTPTEGRQIFTLIYKEGPVQKFMNFYASNLESAQAEGDKFLRHISSRDNRKVVAVGRVKPFAVTIDEEIETWNRKNAPRPSDPY